MYREFFAPDDEDVYEAAGEWPDVDESGARVLLWGDEHGGSLTFSYNVLERSVRIRWVNAGGGELLDIYRESATRLKFTSAAAVIQFCVEFDMGECSGVLEVQVAPTVNVQDRLLYR